MDNLNGVSSRGNGGCSCQERVMVGEGLELLRGLVFGYVGRRGRGLAAGNAIIALLLVAFVSGVARDATVGADHS
jgi:hypothetical protein